MGQQDSPARISAFAALGWVCGAATVWSMVAPSLTLAGIRLAFGLFLPIAPRLQGLSVTQNLTASVRAPWHVLPAASPISG